ncbi:protein-disulfide reductase DsbD domain-containing protein [Aminobacter sp. Piv2-1]|uniref:protein-disulfide reductase DsbD domain-containing protein n=1 Tax=Aminobacter sp. Piv2-1 TaxID=3031122 RepID=UPI0030A829E2
MILQKTLAAGLGLILFGVAAPAYSSASDWGTTEGGRFRLVTAGRPDAEGKLQGVLFIELKPGWKTYWRDPGDSGVPPQIDVTASRNVSAVEMSFPAPQRHDDGYSIWAGYDYPVGLPVTFTIPSPGEPSLIEADVFLGVCETICVPVQARLQVDPAADPDNPDDVALVEAAFEALPAPAQADFGVTPTPGGDGMLSVVANVPGSPEGVDLFVAGTDGYLFGVPKRNAEAGKLTFTVKVIDRPDAPPTGKGIPYTLTTATSAVEGFLPYP